MAWGGASKSKFKRLRKTQRYVVEKILPRCIVAELENEHEIFQKVGILTIPLLTSYIIATNKETFKKYST